MPGDYAELANQEILAFDYGENFVLKQTVLKYLKTGAGLAYSAAASLSGIPGIGAIPALVSAAKTQGHISGLKRILENDAAYACTCGLCAQTITFAINQKEWKLGRKIVSAVPGLGTLEAVRSKVYGGYKKWKGNSGTQRMEAAVALWDRGKNGCPKAKAAVWELFGGSAKGTKVLTAPTGYELLADKLRST